MEWLDGFRSDGRAGPSHALDEWNDVLDGSSGLPACAQRFQTREFRGIDSSFRVLGTHRSRDVTVGCDHVAVMLHLRSLYVSKAAILTLPALSVPDENRSPA
jgi:hypothetical protein